MIERRSAERRARRETQAEKEPPNQEPQKERPILECANCGTPFQRGQNANQVYCQRSCQEAAQRKRIATRRAAARASGHPLAERYPLEESLRPPVTCAQIFRQRFQWPYSIDSRRNIALRAARLLGRDLEAVERAITRHVNQVAQKYIPHDLADALLIAAKADHWRLPAFPSNGACARKMAETYAEIHEPELNEAERIELAHALTQYAEAYFAHDIDDAFEPEGIDPRVYEITFAA
jgi:hypothetical protein